MGNKLMAIEEWTGNDSKVYNGKPVHERWKRTTNGATSQLIPQKEKVSESDRIEKTNGM